MDKCPLCKKSHEYEKTWASVVPPVKTKMLSTLLSSCPQFLALPAEQKLVSVTAHAACLLCTSWEHPRHKFGGKEQSDPKCRVLVAGAECGGKHGKWYHASSGTTGNVVSISKTKPSPSQTPGLFEVYRADFREGGGGQQ